MGKKWIWCFKNFWKKLGNMDYYVVMGYTMIK